MTVTAMIDAPSTARVGTRRRAGAAAPKTPLSALSERHRVALRTAALGEVKARGGETTIVGIYDTAHLGLLDYERRSRLTLFERDGWLAYSKAFGARRAALRYVVGEDDNGPWALRVPGTVATVVAALARVKPTAVKRARAARLGVLRQGDIYAIEAARTPAEHRALAGTRHTYDVEARRLVHLDAGARHGDLVIPASWRGVRFARQGGLGMGRLVGAKARDVRD